MDFIHFILPLAFLPMPGKVSDFFVCDRIFRIKQKTAGEEIPAPVIFCCFILYTFLPFLHVNITTRLYDHHLTIFQMGIKRFHLFRRQIHKRRIIQHFHRHIMHAGRYRPPFRNKTFDHRLCGLTLQQFTK